MSNVKVIIKLRGNVQSFILPSNLAIFARANNEINRTHKRALSALYGDYESTFEEIVDEDKLKTIQKRSCK